MAVRNRACCLGACTVTENLTQMDSPLARSDTLSPKTRREMLAITTDGTWPPRRSGSSARPKPEAGKAATQPTTIRVLPSGSRSQNSGGTGAPMRLTSGSTSTPLAFSSAW
jgi:hypothetical protein